MSDSTRCCEVPGVELIVQDKTVACWYASAMMVVNWVDGKRSICSSVDDQRFCRGGIFARVTSMCRDAMAPT